MAKALELKNISFQYRGRTNDALGSINLEVYDKEFLLVVGESGSGKSSLIRVINGLIPHFYSGTFSGRVYFYDEDITNNNAHERFGLGISTVLQFPEDQILARKVWRAVAFGLANLGYQREEILKRVKWALKIVGMERFFDQETDKLSSGQKQKIALASALAIQPKLLLLDEPTSQLDPISARRFLEKLNEIRRNLDITIIISEHKIDEIIDFISRILVLKKGKIAFVGPSQELFYSRVPEIAGIGYPKVVSLANNISFNMRPVSSRELIDYLKQIHNIEFKSTKSAYLPRESLNKTSLEKILIVRDIWFKYNREWVLKGISFDAFQGEFIALMGSNGAGKTTLARVISGFLKPQKGHVFVNGMDVTVKGFKDAVGRIVYVPQNPEDIIFNSTVFDEIAFSLRNMGYNERGVRKLVIEAAKKFRIEHLLSESPYSISGGEKLRVVLASLYVMRPKIFILDEPTRGLDWKSKMMLLRELLRLKEGGGLIILITHDVELIAESPVNRVIVMHEGQILSAGSKREILSSSEILNAGLLHPKVCEIMNSLGYKGVVTLEEAIQILSEVTTYVRK